MNEPSLQKPRRKLTNLELSAPARGALRRLKARHGMSFTHAVERGVLALEESFALPEPMPEATRARLGLPTGPVRENRKRGAK